MLIYIDSLETLVMAEDAFGVQMNLYCVYDTFKKFFNSPLWFDMYKPDEEIIHGSEIKSFT